MQTPNEATHRIRRTLNELVMAEMFLVQATLESAAVIGDGISELGRQLGDGRKANPDSWQSISSTLQRIADDAREPYTTRYRYFREIIQGNS